MKEKVPGPNDKDILKELSVKADLWKELTRYLEAHYEHVPIITFEGKDRTLTIRYRRGGKTLVTLYPGKGEMTVLVVLGKDEVAKAKEAKLNKSIKGSFEKARQYHDGRWLWLHPSSKGDIESIEALLAVKRTPKKA